MTLDEAIKHAEKTADNLELEAECIRSWGKENDTKQGVINCEKCAKEHRQLAEWQKELKKYKEKDTPKLVIYSGDGYADGHMVYDWAECPSCSFTIEESDADWEMPYCPSCGKALKWEAEE